MNNVISAIQDTISISLFNKGLAGKIFSEVRKTGAKVVVKNNQPEAVLLSPEEYIDLVNAVNDARLLQVAEDRLSNYHVDTVIPEKELLKHLDLTDEELSNLDEVDFE